eukprot:97242-Chlamydomonas_euryale.AAC.1
MKWGDVAAQLARAVHPHAHAWGHVCCSTLESMQGLGTAVMHSNMHSNMHSSNSFPVTVTGSVMGICDMASQQRDLATRLHSRRAAVPPQQARPLPGQRCGQADQPGETTGLGASGHPSASHRAVQQRRLPPPFLLLSWQPLYPPHMRMPMTRYTVARQLDRPAGSTCHTRSAA